MQADTIYEILRKLGQGLNAPSFYTAFFSAIDPNQPEESDLFETKAARRNVELARHLSKMLINEEGGFEREQLEKALDFVRERIYPLSPLDDEEGQKMERMYDTLLELQKTPSLIQELMKIDVPYNNPLAIQYIEDTLLELKGRSVSKKDAKRAALTALLTSLRQSVGSCFATAPAMIVHEGDKQQFLHEIRDLIETGKITRVQGQNEYSAPLTLSIGTSDFGRFFYVDKEFISKILGDKIFNMICKAFSLDKASIQRNLFEGRHTSLKEIFKQALMKKWSLTEKDLEDDETKELMKPVSEIVISEGKTPLKKGVRLFKQEWPLLQKMYVGAKENPLLKAWEYTVASFAETKPAFTRWNLYASLGLNQEEEGGIGFVVYQQVRKELERANQKIEQLNREVEGAYYQVKTLEGRVNRAEESESKWLLAEYRIKVQDYQSLVDQRASTSSLAQRIASLFQDLMEAYDSLFPSYFQEVYDADMKKELLKVYDDSPAGFRLLYKHGRKNPSSWSMIEGKDQFVSALSSFFVSTENTLLYDERFKGLESQIVQIVASIVHHVRSLEFLQSAFHRMAKAHGMRSFKNPLDHLDEIEKKPWAYVSGGTMANLVQCYFGSTERPKSKERWVESPLELLVFLIDTLKELPSGVLEPYLQDERRSLLMHSPTHAFTLKPGLSPFKEAFSEEFYPFTWIRDQWVEPRRQFYDHMLLNCDKVSFLSSLFAQERGIKESPPSFLSSQETVSPSVFWERFKEVNFFEYEQELFDAFLMNSLPLIETSKAYTLMKELLNELSIKEVGLDAFFEGHREPYFTKKAFFTLALTEARLFFKRQAHGKNYPLTILSWMRKKKIAPPVPISFADTNWREDLFAFTIHAGTSKWELFRYSPQSDTLTPMSHWKEWLDGSKKHPMWGVYVDPRQYSRYLNRRSLLVR